MTLHADQKERHQFEAELQKIAEEVSEQYYYEFWRWAEELELCELSSPHAIWEGIAQALADISGFKVILQEAIPEFCAMGPNTFRIIGHQDAIIAEPTLFSRTASRPGQRV